MNIMLNGKAREISDNSSLQEMLEEINVENRRIAVEVNREIIPRAKHPEFELSDGDHIEIIQAVGGG